MSSRLMTFLLLLFAATAALAPGASAQVRVTLSGADEIQPTAVTRVDGEFDPNQFGTGWNTKVIPASAFTGMGSDHKFVYTGSDLLRATAGSNFWAPLNMPPGTEVQKVCVFVEDNSTTNRLAVRIRRSQVGSAGAATTTVAGTASDVSGTPGYTWICAQPDAPVLIRAYDSAYSTWNAYSVDVEAALDSSIRWGAISVTWRRAMSPAPATATFPSDVPTTHPFFQYIEALAASGITAGCGAGSFCPNATLTRGQMAVFLTAALGLYWPE